MTPRSLYTRIFLWFCLTIAATTSLVVLIAAAMGSQPFGRRWMAMTQDLYAHSAVDFYITGGAPALRQYLTTIDRSSAIDGHLLTRQGVDVLGAPFPEHEAYVFERAQSTGHSVARLSRYWVAATPIYSPDSSTPYIFVMEAHPLRGFLDGTFFTSFAPRILLGVLLIALFCLLLARHITRPIRILQSAAARMASGDLTVRTLPSIRSNTTELADLATAFDSMAERIETLLRTQRQTLADISHELRSPLTRIAVSLELLRRGQMDVLEPMQADLDGLNLMIGQVLELSRYELQPLTAPLQAVDLRALLEDLAETATYEGQATANTILLDAPSTPCRVAAEASALRSCLENVIRNALQYSPAGEAIRIRLATEEDNHFVITVDDTGPGVPVDALPHLFAPFFRVPGTAVQHPHGTGLGLSISARIAARYQGSLTATNRAPHGLSVRLMLPAATAV
jgi:two-component system sensor histidine kinase CpxA